MKQHLEIEYKSILTNQEYLKIDFLFKFDKIVEQTNVYYDFDDILFNQNIMCRIRVLDDEYEFTLKIPQEKGVLEYEVNLNSLDIKDPKVIKILTPFIEQTDQLIEVGRSHTIRKIYSDEYGEWCLDESQFSHHKDYELEYELYEDHPLAYEHYVNKINELGIEIKEAKPKYIRALNSKKTL